MAPKAKQLSLFDPAIVRAAALDSLRKLDPRHVAKNPVMFVVEVGSVLTTVLWLRDRTLHPAGAAPGWFTLSVSLWLWFTVVFANFAAASAMCSALLRLLMPPPGEQPYDEVSLDILDARSLPHWLSGGGTCS